MQLEMESLSVQTLLKLGHLSKRTIVLISGVLPSAVVFSRRNEDLKLPVGASSANNPLKLVFFPTWTLQIITEI